MKNLILVATILVSFNSMATCNLNLKVKKVDAKTAYLKDQTISASMQKKLIEGGCTVNKTVMSTQEITALKIKTLRKKLAKLGVK